MMSTYKYKVTGKHFKHWLYDYVPKVRAEAKGWRKLLWAIFGNDDDGLFGEVAHRSWRERWGSEASFKRAFLWWVRNPLHNFTFFVIGSADREHHTHYRILFISRNAFKGPKYFDSPGRIWGEEGISSLWIALHDNKPFFSLRLKIPFMDRYFTTYVGARTKGTWGAAIRIKKGMEM